MCFYRVVILFCALRSLFTSPSGFLSGFLKSSSSSFGSERDTPLPPPPLLPWMSGGNQLKVPDDGGIINVCSGGGYILDILSNLLLCLTWDVITRRHQQLLPSVSTSTVSSRYSGPPTVTLLTQAAFCCLSFCCPSTPTTSSSGVRTCPLTVPLPSFSILRFRPSGHPSWVVLCSPLSKMEAGAY